MTRAIQSAAFGLACAFMAHALAEYVRHPHPFDFAALCGIAAAGLMGAMLTIEGDA